MTQAAVKRNCPNSQIDVSLPVRYLVKARVKIGQEKPLLGAIADGSLGRGSIAGDEYIYDLQQARVGEDGVAHWVETCFCATPLQEEQPYWEKHFELLSVKEAHNRKNCRHENGAEPWACSNCDCTKRLEEKLRQQGKAFLDTLRKHE
jgi:hypothetical protein